MASSSPQEIQITVTSNEVTTSSKITVTQWTKHRASRFGMRWCGFAWLGALICLPIPGLHFVAVPACLFIGPPLGFVIYRFYSGSIEIISGSAICPQCKAERVFANQTVDWPYNTACEHCRADWTVLPV